MTCVPVVWRVWREVDAPAAARNFGASHPVRCWLGSLPERRNAGFVCLVLLSYVAAVLCSAAAGDLESQSP